MSNDFAEFTSMEVVGNPKPSSNMKVTAFVGGEFGKCIQLTTDKDFICLSENQVLDLIDCFVARICGRVTATGYEYLGKFEPKKVE